MIFPPSRSTIPVMVSVLLLIIIYLSFISLGLPDSLLGSAWPSMYGSLAVPLHYAGIPAMIVAGGTVISSIFSERIIRRLGTGPVTAISVFMTAAALIAASLSPTFILFCLCAVPLGLGAGSVDAALNNYVALHYKARHMSWLHGFWGVGASIGPLIMSNHLINGEPWNLGYRTVGIIQCCLVAVLCISLPLWGKNTVPEGEAQKRTITYRALLRLPGLKQALVTFFCYCSIEQIVGLWGASFLVIARNIPPELAAQWIALYYGGIMAGRFISGFVTIKLNNRQMVRLGQALVACGIAFLFLPFTAASLLPGFFIIGLGCAPIYPSLLHETPKNFGSEYSQIIMGLQMATAYIGITVMPPLFGWIASHTNFNIFPVCIGILLLLKTGMSETVNKKVDAGLKVNR
ncbi:MFS transporter [Spirochaetia bacterium]|nr:MFS transporter [Spirochaetia bacterium]